MSFVIHGRFTVPTLAAQTLTDFATRLLAAVNVPTADAALVASSLVGANLRGHDSHGVMRVPQYVSFIEGGQYRIGVDLKIEHETPAVVVCDGQWGLGQVQAHRLLDLAIPKARRLGVAVATARDCGHIGRLGEYAERAAAAGLALIGTVNNCGAGQRVAPPGGREPRLGTNPFCAGVPTAEPDKPIVADFGTSVVAEGKVRSHYISKQPVPPGWLLDHEGQPTTDPAVLYEQPRGTILPLGGAQAYKGFGLGLILECWAGGLTGGRCSHAGAPSAAGNNVVFFFIEPEQFAGRGALVDQATELGEFVRSTPRASGVDAILLPGDPERRSLSARSVGGIHLDDNHWDKLTELAVRLGVAQPK
jgi:uncharacterized oxidoreductase